MAEKLSFRLLFCSQEITFYETIMLRGERHAVEEKFFLFQENLV